MIGGRPAGQTLTPFHFHLKEVEGVDIPTSTHPWNTTRDCFPKEQSSVALPSRGWEGPWKPTLANR